MPSLGDSALIFFLALLLFGPKKLPELARQLGKLMGEFRRASNEFRMQMEEELRVSEQEERQKKIAALEAAAPRASAETPSSPALADIPSAAAPIDDPMDAHPHMIRSDAPLTPALEATPIASSGDLRLMPPASGLPIGRSTPAADTTPALATLAPVLDGIPQRAELDDAFPKPPDRTRTIEEAPLHG